MSVKTSMRNDNVLWAISFSRRCRDPSTCHDNVPFKVIFGQNSKEIQSKCDEVRYTMIKLNRRDVASDFIDEIGRY